MDPVVQTVLSASEQGHKQRLAALLHDNPGLAESCDEEGSTPLMYAAANGRENVLHLLIQSQVNVNMQNLYGWTALMQAACYGHLTCVMLLVQYKADVKLCNNWGASALVGAAQGGFGTVVQFLLEQGAAVNNDDEVASLTPLMAAAQCGHVEIAGKLIRAGSNVNTVLKTTGWSALMLAAINNQKEVVTLLLQHGAEKDHRDISKRTALQLANELGHRELAMDGETNDTVSEADFFEAVNGGQSDRVQVMLRKSAELAKAKTKDGLTPLMWAANKGHVKVCEILLRTGCPVNAKDSVNGWTALMQATHQRRYEVAKLLGGHGAAVNLRGKSGSTAFDIANMLGDIEMIRIIASISVERIRKTSAPITTSPDLPLSDKSPTTPSATPTSARSSPSTTESIITEGGPQKKLSVPVCPPQLKIAPPSKPLDVSELIRKLKMAYSDPTSPDTPTTKGTMVPIQGNPEALQRFPSSRLRNQRIHPGTIPLSPGSSTESVSPGTSTSTSNSAQFDDVTTSQSRDYPLTPDPPKSASFLPSQHSRSMEGEDRTRFLSHSNPPPTNSTSGKRGGRRGGVASPSRKVITSTPFNRHSQFSLETGLSKFSTRPNFIRGGAGGRELSYLYKFSPPSHIPPTIAVAGRPKEFIPKSWTPLEAEKLQLQNVPTTRKRSYTDPSKSALQRVLEQAYLGEYYDLFVEQELDLSSFLTLSEGDLIDLCITNSNDRRRLLALIQKLQNRNKTDLSVERNGASSNNATPAPLFMFQ